MKRTHGVVFVCGLMVAAAALAHAQSPKLPVPAIDQSAVGARGFFYVGGTYKGAPGSELMHGQAYVEVVAPKVVRRPYPLVLIHGAGQTATNWMGTPDGRKGWADYFVEQGYVVYMIDQPMRGRSPWHPSDGPTRMSTAPQVAGQFTAGAVLGSWPQAKKHTQWPGEGAGKGQKGDAAFDAFYATQVETLISPEETQRYNQAAGAALLDRIGPAILLTHSQSGAFGWLIADARPALVKGIVAVEPAGPPFEAAIIGTGKTRPWGPTDIPITYDPPVKDASEIAVEREAAADGPDLFVCWMQKAPARQLVNLKRIPTMVMAAEASYHQVYDHCTAKYLRQAGMNVEYIRLQDKGIRGNGHMVMIEKNNLDIARVVDEWLQQNVKAADPNAAGNPYRMEEGWAKLPEGRKWGAAIGVDIAPDGRSVWVFDRCATADDCSGSSLAPIQTFDATGRLVASFGGGLFNYPHGFFVDRDENVWVSDGRVKGGKGHTVMKFSPDGRLLMTLGKPGMAGNGPDTFNGPSDVLVAPSGEIFVADGHGGETNARIVKLSRDGRFIKAWGRKGSGPGEFDSPHGLAMDSAGRLFVADRSNNRIQIFDQEGRFLDEWRQFGRPSGLFIDRHDVLYAADSQSTDATNPGYRQGIRIGSVRDGLVTAFIPWNETNTIEGVAVDADGNVYAGYTNTLNFRRFSRK